MHALPPFLRLAQKLLGYTSVDRRVNNSVRGLVLEFHALVEVKVSAERAPVGRSVDPGVAFTIVWGPDLLILYCPTPIQPVHLPAPRDGKFLVGQFGKTLGAQFTFGM